MKSKAFYFLLLTFFILAILFTTMPPFSTATTSTTGMGSAIISVLNKQDNSPVFDATICIVETKEYYQTNKLGSIKLSLPAKSTNKLQFKNPQKEWQEYTLLIYKNGFYPHIYHSLKITSNITRSGIVINLEEILNNSDISYTQEYEYPNNIWCEQLINNHKK